MDLIKGILFSNDLKVTILRTNLTYMVFEPELPTSTRWDISNQRKQPTTEMFLQQVVDACAANVVALDETGVVLHVSRTWRIFAAKNGFPAEGAYGLDALQSCNKTPA